MDYRTIDVPAVTIGLDLGDKRSHLVALNHAGEITADDKVPTTREALNEVFSRLDAARVVIEAGTQSAWVAQLLESLGHEVIVANPSALGKKSSRRRKNDRIDALSLAREGRVDPRKLRPIRHRSPQAQEHLSILRMRDALVRSRTLLVNSVRSYFKVKGERLPPCSTPAFAKRVRDGVREEARRAVNPVLKTIEELSATIAGYDKAVTILVKEKYPDAERLSKVRGVGHLTALAFILTIEDPKRFQDSRTVGAFLGLVPALRDSGGVGSQLRISKAGNTYLRRLMVTSAQYILGHFGEDCDLRRYGEAIARKPVVGKSSPNAKKRAVVAVARKLAVLLHHLWVSGDRYDPLYKAKRKEQAAA